MLKKAVATKLNRQVNGEIYSAYLYLAMAAYFDSINLKGFAHWMQMQVREELTHAQRIMEFISDRGGKVALTAIEAPKATWASPQAAMDQVYEHECAVSESINQCVTTAIKADDHATNGFLVWFVAEQVEEEATADEIVQKLKLVGKDSSGLFMLDTELKGRQLGPTTLAILNNQGTGAA